MLATALVAGLMLAGCTGQAGPKPEAAAVPSAPHLPLVVPVVPIGGDTPSGLQTRVGAEKAVDAADSRGAVGIRLAVDIRWLCPTLVCDMSRLAPVVEYARSSGLVVYLHVNSTPEWLDPRGRWYGPTGQAAETWADLFAQFVRFFGTDVAGYEVWNEPNNPSFWSQGPDPRQYAELLKAVWQASNSVNPEVRLIGVNLSNNDLGYMSRLSAELRALGGSSENGFYYDELGVHPYAGELGAGYHPRLPAGSRSVHVATGEKDMTYRGIERLRAQVARDEGVERRVVVGEFGYDRHPGGWYHVPEPRRAEYLAAALELAAGWPWLDGFTVYTHVAWPGEGFTIAGTPSEAAVWAAAGDR